MGKVQIFITEFGEIALVQCIVLELLGDGVKFQQTCLSEKEGFQQKKTVTTDAACKR